MKIRTLLLTAAAAAMMTTAGASAAWDRDRDHDGRPDHGWAERHDRDGFNDAWRGRADWHWRDDHGRWHGDRDRYWRYGYRGYISDRDIYYRSLRAHGYYRWDGAPYWYQGRYVVRSYDRWGRVVFVEMNPYTGGFLGVIRF
ncbi:hypothetical protein FHS83_000939 [Rhizomicrobium palustre]|uniref:Uncharacterized protein n=1 Tax=Rhizomicrobium palustre TaxID=189966 RepID=A0A846MWU6_9PROT|nr:hypothetical protein [Rhizomicrobium palustre]NIK87621.1 hypothetical protein [Rhizomicrobium palustre]